MGLFSALGKLVKKVWGGIKKAFKAVMKPVAKFLDSKLGKSLMLAVSVFSMGTALLAGAKGFAAGQGFLGKFVNGGKEFLNSLLGTSFETAGGEGAANAVAGAGEAAVAGAENAVQAGDILTGGDPTAVGADSGLLSQASDAAGQAAPAIGDPNAIAKMASPGGTGLPGTQPGSAMAGITQGAQNVAKEGAEKGWLSKAADAALDFVKSDTGQTIIGNTIQGAGAGARQRELQEHERRVERMFEDPNDPGMRMLREHDYSIDAPRGVAAAPSQYSQRQAQGSGRYTPHIPFRRPATSPTG